MKTPITLMAFLCLFLNPFLSKAQVPDSNSTVKEWLDHIYAQLDTSSLVNTGVLMDR